jgi:hypothetical protein
MDGKWLSREFRRAIRLMVQEGLIEVDGDTLTLTDKGWQASPEELNVLEEIFRREGSKGREPFGQS